MSTSRGARAGLIVGSVIILLGIITLGLSLGALRSVENVAWVAVGLVAAGAFGVGYIENQQQGWMLLSAYVFLCLSILMSVWIVIGGGAVLSATALSLIGLPFALSYLASAGKAWSALLIAAILFITAQVVLFSPLIRLLSSDRTQSGLYFGASFLLALAAAFVVLWFPNRRDPHFAWAVYPPHVLFVLAVFLILVAIGWPQLAIPALLLYIGGIFLLRFLLHLQSS